VHTVGSLFGREIAKTHKFDKEALPEKFERIHQNLCRVEMGTILYVEQAASLYFAAMMEQIWKRKDQVGALEERKSRLQV